jgi:heat-inducible transcriptional repressor
MSLEPFGGSRCSTPRAGAPKRRVVGSGRPYDEGMELSPRKREILRRVVEVYVETGQPVGSRVLVERPGLQVSSSTVRSELSELEAIGLLTHPHTSAGRVPTESGYRLYAEELVGAIEGRPGPFPVDLTTMRNELEEALRRTTEALSDATHLLALVTAPAIQAAAVRHVEVLQLQPRVVIVVVITASGSVSKRVVEFDDAVDPGIVEWAAAYFDETIVGRRASSSAMRRTFEDPGLSLRERVFLDRLRPAFAEVVATATDLYVGGAAGLLGDARGAELEACHRLLDVLERRAAVLGLLQEALDPNRTVVRVGPELEGEELHGASYVGTTYGLPNRSLGAVGLLGPLRMDYDKAIRAVRAAAFELSRLVEDVYGAP